MKFHVFLFVHTLVLLLVTVCSNNAATIAVEDGIECPRDQSDTSFVVQIPSPSNCGIFYKCDRGRPRVNKCPEGLHYSKRLMTCDFPSRAHCAIAVAE